MLKIIRMKHLTLLLVCCWALLGQVRAQPYACGTDARLTRALTDPAVRARAAAYSNAIHQATLAAPMAKAADASTTYVLPVVFHVVHNNGPENLADAEIQACLADVNAYFDAAFAGPNTASTVTGIQFCLASRDDWGRPSTGIEHLLDPMRTVCTTDSEFNEMTRRYYWPSTDVINIYVLKDMGGTIGMGMLPFMAPGENTDGVYMVWDHCGRDSTLNRVLAHELGHYLGLFHTFQGGCTNEDCLMQGDFVCDTPPDEGSVTFEGCLVPLNSCTTDSIALTPQNPFDRDVRDQSHNFMDYNHSECLELFTPGQCQRMRLSLEKWRPGLLHSQYCDGTRLAEAGIEDFHADDFFVCPEAKGFRVRVVNNGLHALQELDIAFGIDEGPIKSFHWQGAVMPTGYKWINLPALTDIPPGKHRLHVQISNPNGFVDPFPANDTLSFTFYRPGAPRRLPYHADFEEGLEEGWNAFDTKWAVWQAVETSGCDSLDRNGAITLTPPYLGDAKKTWLVSGWIDLGGDALPYMRFDYAFRRRPGLQRPTRLLAYILTDCDTLAVEELLSRSWNQLSGPFYYDRLHTWVPESCDDWKTVQVALPDWLGDRIMVAFATDISLEHNQRIYLDNVRISSPEADARALAGPTAADVLLYPVPNDGRFVVEFPSLEVRSVTLRIYNSIGQLVHAVKTQTGSSTFQHTFDLRASAGAGGLASGVYHLDMRVGGDAPVRKKFVVYFE